VQIDYNVLIPMRDGVKLSAAICRPDGRGPFPCLLSRSCYTKWALPIAARARYWTSNGCVLVLQDVRGRGDSDGRFYPLINEQCDGLDTLDWLAAQPWSDGRILLFGASYAGWTQLYIAGDNHPSLVAAVPTAAPPDPDRSFPRHHGMLVPGAAAWLATLDGHTNQDLSECDVPGAFAALPIIEFDRHIGRHLKAWRDWTEHPPGTPYWRAQSYQEKLLNSRVPMLHISGWYDDCLIGTTENFAAMTTRAHDLRARARQRMIIGPWLHGAIGHRRIGGFDYGPQAELNGADLHRDWFNIHLRGETDTSPPVRLFVMGRNQWIEEKEWPLARTTYVPYYLHSSGRANGRLGNGTLSTAVPGEEPPDQFTYDPADPVSYTSTFDWRQESGPDDFAEIELREDILVYTGPLITSPLLVCGPLLIRLFAASSARDTDWTAKVLDVYPDGRSIRLNDGAVRARFRHGATQEDFLTPGAVEEYLIDCWSTCIELQVSHRLRVEISSSAFGKIDLNLNGGGPIGRESRPIVAEQTIYHDSRRPSHLVLPVVRA
jgi:putative CocE/NonD family hydrolase